MSSEATSSRPQTGVSEGEEPVEEWAGPPTPDAFFTIFVVLPNEEVCTLRNLPSGIVVFDLKGRLELLCGLPSQLYALMYPDGEELPDHQRLLILENIRDGYLLRMQLYDNWDSLYLAVTKNNIEHVYHSGGVHLRGNIVISQDETEKFEGVVRERGTVALYMASFLGLIRMVNMLLSVGVDVNGTTPFGRTAIHASVARDNGVLLDILLKHGASSQNPDCFGYTALDIAKEMASTVCAKKLRVMQLNLRGMSSQNGGTASPGNRRHVAGSKLSGKESGNQPLSDRERPATETDLKLSRTRSSLSRFSETSTVLEKSVDSPRHKCRKNISSSAPVKENKDNDISASNNSFLSPRDAGGRATARTQKRVVTWRDLPRDNEYWELIEFTPGEKNNIDDAISIKPLKIIHQKKILKFAKYSKEGDSKPGSENEPVTAQVSRSRDTGSAISRSSTASSKKSRKLNKTSSKGNGVSDMRSMRRKIHIASKRTEGPTKNSDAFNEWLARKRRQADTDESETSDDDDDNAADSEEEKPKLEVFNKWVRKHNRVVYTSPAPGNRPIADVIEIGSTMAGDGSNPPPEENIAAHRLWQRSKGFAKMPIRRQTVQDFLTERRKLEEKRKKLLLSAISYEEWMDHVEDKKFLIQQILKADLSEMKRLEEERFRGRLTKNSFEEWKERIRSRENEDRKRREIQRKYDEEQSQLRQRGKSSAAVPFDDWVRRKQHALSARKHRDAQVRASTPRKPAAPQEEVDSAYENWLLRKHREEMDHIESQIRKERAMLGALKQRRTPTLAAT